MSNEKSPLYWSNYHNCVNLTVHAMLLKQGVNVEYIWGQSSLVIEEYEEYIRISPYHKEWPVFFNKHHGVTWHKLQFNVVNDYVEEITKLLKEKRTVALEVDIYKLPYCVHYEKYHDFHAIEILNIDGDKLEICDHYYHYHGYLKFEDLFNALNNFITYYSGTLPSIYYFDVQQHLTRNYNRSDLLEVIKENINVMKGAEIVKDKQGKTILSIGIKAFPKLKEMLMVVLDNPLEVQRLGTIGDFYMRLKEICHSRYNFYQLLNMYQESIYADKYRVLANNWLVVANLLLKIINGASPDSVKARVNKKLEDLFEKEVELINEMEKLISE
ncbi:hypothetical protein FZD47_20805 [Bacillus infantis]|uniref:Butirosin biosynthesis protein H N-terminal domain-containing protein n=1 Tax=Bacillus infantis TaxID=324767 RepID=A0A5D4SDA3_9BACI|nr:BtrH N-terminal domain-containing protein [Bacillus infantis]TYS60651.1 hypothetical protein FZD47_20805 [Bacillus infantis]